MSMVSPMRAFLTARLSLSWDSPNASTGTNHTRLRYSNCRVTKLNRAQLTDQGGALANERIASTMQCLYVEPLFALQPDKAQVL
jgi:hypothetical protein